MRKFLCMTVATAIMACSAWADMIPYGPSGTENPTTYAFTAAATGDVVAYFYGESADFGSKIGLLRNGLPTGFTGLQNHSTAVGTSFNLGPVTAGDTLVLFLEVSNAYAGPPPLTNTWFSKASMNADGGFNHVYATPFSGGSGIYSGIPVGTYIGWEDISGGGDKDYNDHQFVFTNVSVPDGGMTLMLLGGALVGLETLRRKFRA